VVVRSAVTGPDSSRTLKCQHTEVPCRRSTWYPTQIRTNCHVTALWDS